MNNFTILQKTKLIFGKDTVKQVGSEIKKYGNSCLIVHDGGTYLKDLLDDVKNSLKEEGIEYFELSNVCANPLLSTANQGIEICKKNNVEFVLAVGGGSAMDTAKYIAVATNCPFPAIEYNLGTKSTHNILHHGCISTLSGTGSEFSNCAMIVNDSVDPVVKAKLLNSDFFNDFAIVNPELNYSLPPKQTACGAVDIISHCLEVYLIDDDTVELSDYYFEGIIKTVLRNAPLAYANPTNYDARANLCIASNLAMVPNMSTAGSFRDWPVHGFENNVTARYHRTHGEILGILTPAYIKWCYENDILINKLVRWSVECMGVKEDYYHPKETILAGVSEFEKWLKSMNLPIHFSDIDIDYEDLDACAEISAPAGNISKLTKEQIKEIYKLAK